MNLDMNWLAVGVIVVLLVSCINGYRRGFVKEVVSAFFVVLALLAVWAIHPYVNQFLVEHTPVYEGIADTCLEFLQEETAVEVDQEIVSAFYDEESIGLVFMNDSEENTDKQYVMEVYNKNGRQKFTTEFGISYTNIKMSGGQVVMHNSSQVCVISAQGVEKFNGTIDEGNISDFFKLGMNRYVLVLDNGLVTIKFK